MIEQMCRKLGITLGYAQAPRFKYAPGNDAQRQLEARVRELAVRSPRKDRALYNVAEDVTHPTRVMARFIDRLRANKADREAREAAALLLEYAER